MNDQMPNDLSKLERLAALLRDDGVEPEAMDAAQLTQYLKDHNADMVGPRKRFDTVLKRAKAHQRLERARARRLEAIERTKTRMLSNAQKGLLKRAQAEAGLEDVEYRDAIETVSALPGCRSSTDARLTDDHFDALMSYIEAIYWHKVDTDDWHLHEPCNGIAVFQQRGYWASKNRRGDTSRDRFTESKLRGQIQQLEQALADLGYGFRYVQGIQNRIVPFSLVNYLAALQRTLKSKRKASLTLPGH